VDNVFVTSSTPNQSSKRVQEVIMNSAHGDRIAAALTAHFFGDPLNRNRGQVSTFSTAVLGTYLTRPQHGLTGICLHEYIPDVESTFTIVAEPNRRAILSLLLDSERSVGELERELRMSQPSVSKHLRVLRDAGFVASRVEAQRRLYRLRPEPLMELDAWLGPFRRFWSKHVDALERHLDKMDKVPPVKGKKT